MTFKDLEDKGVELERTLRGEAGKMGGNVPTPDVKTPPRSPFEPGIKGAADCQHANDEAETETSSTLLRKQKFLR